MIVKLLKTLKIEANNKFVVGMFFFCFLFFDLSAKTSEHLTNTLKILEIGENFASACFEDNMKTEISN